MSCMIDVGVVPIGPPSSVFFGVTSAVTLTTESRGSPVTAAGKRVLPGMAAGVVSR